MSETCYTATRLKAELLGVLDRVEASGKLVVVTKHGRPVARLVPIPDEAPLAGSVRFVVDDDEIGICAVSTWEVAMLVERGRLELDRPVATWIRRALSADPRTLEIPLSSAIAMSAVALGSEGMHGDPADRFILATAAHHAAPLVTRDAAIRTFAPDRTVW